MNAEGWIPGVWPVGGAPDGDSVTVLDTSHATAPSLFLSLESLLDQMERLKEMVGVHFHVEKNVWFYGSSVSSTSNFQCITCRSECVGKTLLLNIC